MNTSLLTIAVPTFNRAANLDKLLRTLRVEISELARDVQVLVSDNASTDETHEVLLRLQGEWPQLIVRRNDENIGADRNFCACIDEVRSAFFWILGDDDLPKAGVVGRIVELLRSQQPDILYLGSEWVPAITGAEQGEAIAELEWRQIDALDFAREVNVWFTFISGTIVNRQRLLTALGDHTIRRFVGTNLVQLGWVYPLLEAGSLFILVSSRCVLATKENTGGYGLMTVFGVNFPRVTRAVFGHGSAIGKTLISRATARFLPGLLWTSRSGAGKRFTAEAPWQAMREELGAIPAFWMLLVPIGRLPKVAALLVYQLWRVGNRIIREVDRIRQVGPAVPGKGRAGAA